MRVTCGVPTKGRYDQLVLTLQALAFQTHKEFDVIIVDDNEQPVDLRTLPAYQCVLELFNQYKIGWQVLFGQKRGQHFSHQQVQEMAKTDWVLRVDDDEVMEPNVLELLLKSALYRDKVGAVAGLVLPPNPVEVPKDAANLIVNLDLPNVQWFRHPTIRVFDVEHLHSTFLYRKGIEKFNLDLSPAAHREETIFTYGILRQGYKLLVDTGAVTWHFRSAQGGIRSHHDPGFWNHDENVFAQKLLDWGVVKPRPEKIIVLDAGRGDHVIVKHLLPQIKKKYPDVLIASCFPDILNGEVGQISIAEARRNLGNLENHSIYGWCTANKWTGNLVDAFAAMYELG